jgi:HEPN domain-containing protein/predicted nucleotidyltransferase
MDIETLKKIPLNFDPSKLSFDIIGIAAFGSRVKESYTRDSDLDLLVIASGIPEKRQRRGVQIAELKKILPPIPFDILLLTKKETISNFENHNPLFLDIAAEGVVLLDSSKFLEKIIEETRNYIIRKKIEKIEGGWAFPVKAGIRTFLSKISNEDFSKAMLKDGQRDLEIGNKLKDEAYFDKSVYHFQQAVEKFIKAILIAKGIFKKTHFIGEELRTFVKKGDFSDNWREKLNEAAQISGEIEPEVTLTRYPGISDDTLWLPYEEYEEQDAINAMHKAERVNTIASDFVEEWFGKDKANG